MNNDNDKNNQAQDEVGKTDIITPNGDGLFRFGRCEICEHPLRCEKYEYFDFCPNCKKWREVLPKH
jgi:lipopolysaccharide biosynthesis regulator YciM